MTEAEWLETTESDDMLVYLQGGVGERKARLFCCACVRRVWHRLADSEPSRRAVEVAERFADEQNVEAERAEIFGHVLSALARECVRKSMHEKPEILRFVASMGMYASREPQPVERAAQCVLIHCIFGNPFRPVPFDPAWRTDTVIALAAGMYTVRDFSAMPILADALQDAGCDHAEVLSHCRGARRSYPTGLTEPAERTEGAPHVRGCWVLDSVLGKE